jgi:putative pyruvate formate lyase activating enzyme
MHDSSKRTFIRTGFGATVGAICWPFTALLPGCRRAVHTPDPAGAVAADVDPDFEPGYLPLHRSGELRERGRALWNVMEQCRLCPRECGANRVAGETRTVDELAGMMLRLQAAGCHNINVVTPTHYSPHVVLALDVAARRGLRLPLAYNTCGWERPEILKVLDGIVDIYLPDFKYSDGAMAAKYSAGADSYPQMTRSALLEMHRQVGVAKPAADGLMYRGLMIRHLVMPNDVGGTKEVIGWIADNLPKDTYFNLMSQYRPMYEADEYPAIARRVSRDEYAQAVRWAREAGLTNLDIQG